VDLDLSDPHLWFDAARSLKRNIIVIVILSLYAHIYFNISFFWCIYNSVILVQLIVVKLFLR
jgi:hypothetical protein